MGDLTPIYERLMGHFGRQHWWPARTPFEVVVGAILTQRTTWKNAESVVRRLKGAGLLHPERLAKAPIDRVESLVRPAGFFRQKARRIIRMAQHLVEKHDGSLNSLFDQPTKEVRKELLALDGVGKETADSILLYVADKLVFPIDAYTRRILKRMGIVKDSCYDRIQAFFQENLPRDLAMYKEFRALIVKLGKENCKAVMPKCGSCPIRDLCHSAKTLKKSSNKT